ncbi:DUF6351 family protein [Streptomyces albiaxialis]|uniref:DUF6351 family protein n=1 Tax=Streptomyces albiaxialis TaxID=329523 RepID=A0ABN2WJZ7_9ACTN
MNRPRAAHRSRRRPRAVLLPLLVALTGALLAPPALAEEPGRTAPSERKLTVGVLSSRPDAVTGSDALLRVSLPGGTRPDTVRIALNGADVTKSFSPGDGELTGLVEGLRPRANTVTATAPGRRPARLTLTNHPAEGPVFSGPHQKPYVCETDSFELPVIGGTLGEPLDADCSVRTRVDYFYRTTGGAFRPLPGGSGATGHPADLATTTTSTGKKVPYVVRMETGTRNRAVYQTTLLHDPVNEPAPGPRSRPEGWNGRALFTLGGGCTGGWYRQGNTTGGVTDDAMLREGYAVMSSSLNVFGQNCSDLTAAETASMVKERFTEAYGPAAHTIGFGCSGGSYQAYQIADNYPGIFDGIIPGCSFPDVGFAMTQRVTDTKLLTDYFDKAAGRGESWSEEQKRAVTGFGRYVTATATKGDAARIDPTANCGVLPEKLRYDPVKNPRGARCDLYDHAKNVYGTDPGTGFARRPLDNVGIQYGLKALKDGTLTKEQFLDLNERIGGFDKDARHSAGRTEADPEALRTAYRTGRLTNGGGGLKDVPILEYRAYQDDTPKGDTHLRYYSLSMRERLEKANGTSANMVSVLEDSRYGGFSTDSPLLRRSIAMMDRWLTALAADGSDAPRIQKIVRARPDGLREGCNTRDAEPRFLAQKLDRDPDSTCEKLYPSHSFPREVAGESVATDVIKCRTEAPRRDAYGDVRWTDAEWKRLRAVFDRGVCDYDRKGVGQQGLKGTWLRF